MMSGSRRAYIDWARGIAVLMMIEAHTTDAWTRAIEKKSVAYRDANIIGGFAAPMFLWLAGLAVVLSATRTLVCGMIIVGSPLPSGLYFGDFDGFAGPAAQDLLDDPVFVFADWA